MLSAAENRLKVIVDTDCDMDDMMAILYLLKRKNVEVVAITTTGTGMANWKYGAPNVLKLLQLAHNPNIPVSYGAKESLSPYANFPKEWRKGVDEVFNIALPKNKNKASPIPSWKLMIEIIKNSPEKITILSLAPMTNIATALKENPSIKQNIEQIVISGGAIDVPGNIVGKVDGYTNTCSEYNIFLDAKAAEMVISSGIPITLVPLNATQMAPITEEIYQKFNSEKRNTSANFVFEVIRPYVESQENTSVYFWDPVAAAVMTKPSLGSYQMMNLLVNLEKGPNYGCTVKSDSGFPVKVYMSIKPSEFYSLFYKTVSRGD